MLYTLGDFIHNLKEQDIEAENIQSDKALEAINECLPRNLLIARIHQEEKEGDSIMDAFKLREKYDQRS